MARMQDRVIHGYDSVDSTIVWRTVHDLLPGVEPALKRAVDRQREIERAEGADESEGGIDG